MGGGVQPSGDYGLVTLPVHTSTSSSSSPSPSCTSFQDANSRDVQRRAGHLRTGDWVVKHERAMVYQGVPSSWCLLHTILLTIFTLCARNPATMD